MSQWHQKKRLAKKRRENLRRRIFERDKGICTLCKKDNVHLLEILRNPSLTQGELLTLVAIHKIPVHRLWNALSEKNGRLWDMDHILQISEAGPTTITNIRTLCLYCHLMVTKIYWYTLKGREVPDEVNIWSRSIEQINKNTR
jgi:5-methylcytosine-specific restriction endonuclease McrA